MISPYPAGPCPPECPKKKVIKYPDGTKEELDLNMYPGEGIFAQPFEDIKFLDLEFPMGTGTGVYISLMFQLGKWGYERQEVKHTIDVSPVYKEYYALVMDQKEKLESQIKNGFVSLVQAIQDFELIDHDLRKYAEYLKWFRDLEHAKRDLEDAKKKNDKPKIEESEKKYKEAQHIIKAMFIDQVDAHTGETISLRGIAPRWPTIIADFMDLYDEDVTDKDIQDRLDIPRAEAIILKTKNELYRYWKDTFLTNIISRYKTLKQMALARKFSIQDTAKDLIPIISRYKSTKDARFEMKEAVKGTYDWSRLDAQAIALDKWEVWSWKPFVVKEEPFPNVRFAEGPISLKEAGFNKEEIKELLKEDPPITEVPALPAVPIMDKHIRNIMKMIYAEHKVKLGPKHVVDAANSIYKRFSTPEAYKSNVQTGGDVAIVGGPRWEFSPYYIFLRMSIDRYVLKLPNGGMMEDMMWAPLQAFNATQNIIIGHMLEIEAIKEAERREIALMLGYENFGPPGGTTGLDDILKTEYPEFDFEEGKVKEKWEKKEEEEKKNKFKENFEKFQEKLEKISGKSKKIFNKLGLDYLMFWYPTPYNKMMYEIMSKMMQRGPGVAFLEVDQFLKKKAGVPGVA